MSDGEIRGPSRGWLRSRIGYPLLFISAAVGIVALLLSSESEIETTSGEAYAIGVRTLEVVPTLVNLRVESEGTVQPSASTQLIAQVAGEIIEVDEALRAGGRFAKGQLLLRIDPQDYDNLYARALATLERAEVEARYFDAERIRLRTLAEQNMVSESQLTEIERAAGVATASLADAQVQVEAARLDLVRTEIRAPYDGRVASEQVDVGQFLQRGGVIADLYATNQLEIRLPLANSQLAFLDRSLVATGVYPAGSEPAVQLAADYAGELHRWSGKLVRSEGAIDRQSRVVYVVVQVDNPTSDRGVDLPVGLFLRATIAGITVADAMLVPRSAIREDDQVLVVAPDNTLRFRRIGILRYQGEYAVVTEGLQAGELLCVSTLQYVVEGMPVTVIR